MATLLLSVVDVENIDEMSESYGAKAKMSS
jgi:hypothetical protein